MIYTVHESWNEHDNMIIVDDELRCGKAGRMANNLSYALKLCKFHNFDTIKIWKYTDDSEFPKLHDEINL